MTGCAPVAPVWRITLAKERRPGHSRDQAADPLGNHAFLLIPAQADVGQFLETFKEFPPRQKAASFTVDQVMKQLETSGR